MNIADIQGLYVARNEVEDFNILICAQDEEEAMEFAVSYFLEADTAHDAGDIKITEFHDVNTHFDCDYIICTL